MLWDEAQRQLVRQEAALDTLRTQAVAVLSVASIVAGLFGSRVATSGLVPGAQAAVVAAFIFFGLTALLAVVILWPREWTFAHGLTEPLTRVSKGVPVDPEALSYTWAKLFDGWYVTNQTKIDRLTCCFSWACALSGLQVIAWASAIVQPRLFP